MTENEIIEFFREKTIQDIKRYYQVKNFEIENIKDDIKELEYKLTGISAIDYSEERIKIVGYKENYKKEDMIQQKVDLNLKLIELEGFIKNFEFSLQQLGEKEKEILINTYGSNKGDKISKNKLAKQLNLNPNKIKTMAKNNLNKLMYLSYDYEIYNYL